MKIGVKLIALIVIVSVVSAGIGIYAIYQMTGGGSLSDVESYVGGLDGAQKDYLEKHDFVLVKGDDKKVNTFTKVYRDMNEDHVPVFVSTDSVLHTYHIFFDDTLRKIEEQELHPAAVNLTIAMLEMSKGQYEAADKEVLQSAKNNVAYFSVALKLLEPDEDVPAYVKDVVEQELGLIDDHAGMLPSPVFGGEIEEDYSQYVPRGHYTRSETLKRYFKAMMWYGRITFPIDSPMMTKSAILMADGMRDASHNGEATVLWSKIYDITVRFVGEADDLMPADYRTEMDKVWSDLPSDYSTLNETAKMTQFSNSIKAYPDPAIAPMFGKGMRFMGQRYIPDSYMMQELVFDKIEEYIGDSGSKPFTFTEETGSRGFPRGLDVMSILGSVKADEVLESEGDTDYRLYDEQVAKLKAEFDALPEENWTENMYWGWLYTLASLTGDFKDKVNPGFMRDNDWQKVKLNTDLASWAELRHDTILYAKQSYTEKAGSPMAPSAPPPEEKGYVEPVPEFYERLIDLTEATMEDLRAHGMLSEERERELGDFVAVLGQLRSMSNKELKGEDLGSTDYAYLRGIGKRFERLTGSAYSDGLQTTIIADVHTDVNSRKVLEEGVGYVDFVIVKVKYGDGSTGYVAGPIFSYYEFKHPMEDRLTDEKWTSMLKDGSAKGRQAWLKECYGE